MADKQNYESLDPLSEEEVLFTLGTFQHDADAQAIVVSDLKDKLSRAKKKHSRLVEKVADIARAAEADLELYRLVGGELITEAPDLEGTLPLGSPEPDEPDEEELPDDDVPVVEEDDADLDVEVEL